jgi:hypothetical protein
MLCRDGVFRQSSVVGLDRTYELSAVPDEALRTRLRELLRELQVSSDPTRTRAVQRELDSYLFVVALLVSGSSMARLVPLELLRLPADISWTPTYDMGSVIREIVVEQHVASKSVMAKIVQYCLPYIKHNRLNFPELQSLSLHELLAMMQMLAATCLGAYGHVQRQCTWSNRVRLFWMFWNITHSGNAQDMFVFCKTHMSMLRLAIIEYFVWFMQEFMPSELMFMDRILGLTASVHHVFKQFTVIVDSFRQMALQDAVLDIAAINAKAQTCIDKCNRLCKGKSRSVLKQSSVVPPKYDVHVAVRSMNIPRMPSVLHMQCYDPRVTPEQARDIVLMQSHIDLYTLPYNLQCAQAQAMVARANHNTRTTYQSSFLYYCLQCQERTAKAVSSAKMRMRGNCVSCAQCGQHASLLKIQTVGRFVRIFHNTFYYCVTCMQVHAWRADISTIETCHLNDAPARRRAHASQCMVCHRNTNATPVDVLDDELGLMQTLVLCPGHRPPEHEQHVVCNLAGLVYYFDTVRRRPSRRQ